MWKQGGIIFGTAIGLAALVMGLLWLVMPHEYSSTTRILVVQKYTLTDSYTATKSAEKIGDGLSSVIHTSSFIDRVAQSSTVDLSALLAMSEKDKREEWEKTVGAVMISNTSLLELTAFDEDPDRAQRLVDAVAQVLVNEGAAYHGAGDTVELRVVDSALTSNFPARPNLLLYGPAAFLFGAVLGLLIIFFNPKYQFDSEQAMAPKKVAGEKARKPRKTPVPQPPKQTVKAPAQDIPVNQQQTAPQQPAQQAPAQPQKQQPQQQPADSSANVLDVANFADAQLDDQSGSSAAKPQTMHDHTKGQQ